MADNSGLQDGISGAAAGFSVAGPVGAWVGFVAGAFGGKSKRRRAKRENARILKENTKQAYGISKASYESIKKTRGDIQETYTSNLQSDVARYATSGKVLTDEQRNQMIGSNAGDRDTALEAVDIQEAKFKNSDAYRVYKEDYEYMAGGGVKEEGTSFSVPSEGRSGNSFYTEDQKKMLKTLEYDREMDDRYKMKSRFESYAKTLAPTFEEYEKSLYGTDEEKAAFERDTTERIIMANRRLDSMLAWDKAEEQRRYDESMDD